MGFALCTAACYGCGQMISFNPVKVPSITDKNNVRQPLCIVCVGLVNHKRIADGLEPIAPLPGAYEACEESELE